MVDEIFQWQDFDVMLSPATAISRSVLFHGQRAIIRRLIDAVNQAGQHAIIYGERGAGKTSLANVLSDFLQPFTSEDIASARFNCYGKQPIVRYGNHYSGRLVCQRRKILVRSLSAT